MVNIIIPIYGMAFLCPSLYVHHLPRVHKNYNYCTCLYVNMYMYYNYDTTCVQSLFLFYTLSSGTVSHRLLLKDSVLVQEFLFLKGTQRVGFTFTQACWPLCYYACTRTCN